MSIFSFIFQKCLKQNVKLIPCFFFSIFKSIFNLICELIEFFFNFCQTSSVAVVLFRRFRQLFERFFAAVFQIIDTFFQKRQIIVSACFCSFDRALSFGFCFSEMFFGEFWTVSDSFSVGISCDLFSLLRDSCSSFWKLENESFFCKNIKCQISNVKMSNFKLSADKCQMSKCQMSKC